MTKSDSQIIEEYKKKVKTLEKEVSDYKNKLEILQRSKLFKILYKYFEIRDKSKALKKAANVLSSLMPSGLMSIYRKRKNRQFIKNELAKILEKNKDKTVILAPPLIPWNCPLYQRPQHISLQLAKKGYLYFFASNFKNEDHFNGLQKIDDSLYLVDDFDVILELKNVPNKVLHIYSTDMKPIDAIISKARKNGFKILYEYIDEISEKLSGAVNEFVYKRFNDIMTNEDNLVVATADLLLKEVQELRQNNYAFVTNGVEYKHFRNIDSKWETPKEMKEIVSLKKPIIGYYGALASWMDYEMVEYAAQMRPDYEFLFIGFNYDKTLDASNFEKFKNIHFFGPINYKVLPKYARFFNVCTIPFKINEITLSTSPIKAFEYMALRKPIVSSALPECKKYKSILIADNKEEFVDQLDKALELKNDNNYLELLDSEAKQNTWEAKATLISNLIDKNLK